VTDSVLFVDYDNMFRRATELFTNASMGPTHPQLDPRKLVRALQGRSRTGPIVTRVQIFAGLPSAKNEPSRNAAVKASASRWEKEEGTTVVLGGLYYSARWPQESPRDRHTAVSLAVALIDEAVQNKASMISVASSSMVLQGALDCAARYFSGHIQLVQWLTPRLRVDASASQSTVYHLCLDESDYLAMRDRPLTLGSVHARKKPHQARRTVGSNSRTVWDPPLPANERHAVEPNP